uniref:Uncharacterized protein n=1 Tax=Chelonoidis abingdonii TaxID=106734 RepID=A0A8C0GGM3_CHEAB
MAKLLSCVLGPRLYRVYRDRGPARSPRDGDEAAEGAQDGSWVSPPPPPAGDKYQWGILPLSTI